MLWALGFYASVSIVALLFTIVIKKLSFSPFGDTGNPLDDDDGCRSGVTHPRVSRSEYSRRSGADVGRAANCDPTEIPSFPRGIQKVIALFISFPIAVFIRETIRPNEGYVFLMIHLYLLLHGFAEI